MRTQMRDFERRDMGPVLEIIQETMNVGRSPANAIDVMNDLEGGLGTNSPDYAFLARKVVTHEKRVVAICGVYRLNTPPIGIMGICWFAVAPDHQNMGIGTRCVDWCTDVARQEGSKSLFVWASAKAVPFYSKRGFEKSSLKITPKESSILMVKRLTDPKNRSGPRPSQRRVA
jgi:GNAT superfamily N-acetyltransferase